MNNTFEPIATQMLTSNVASVTFSDISQSYTDLILMASIRCIHGATQSVDCYMRFNGDSASNYSRTYIFSSGSSSIAGREPNQTRIGTFYTPGGGATANSFSAEIVHINSYSNPNIFKTILSSNGHAGGGLARVIGLWRSTSPITTIEIGPASETMVTGSTFSLYGIRAA